jgi:hypothetical protein
MKKPTTANANPRPTRAARDRAPSGKIHPVIIYPFKHAGHFEDLESLYQMVARLAADKSRYARPLTVVDRKTHYQLERDQAFERFRNQVMAKHSDIIDAWCVDTCQMWYTGLGRAFESGGENDIYWLIPGDFNYGTAVGQEVLGRLHDLPEIIEELDQDLCIGEIATDHNNSKQHIDTYGTFALLYNWFPDEAQEIRQFTERPRSEFFAIRHGFLREVLTHRWYPYEQTVVMLLLAVLNKKRISRFDVGHISDLPTGRDLLPSAMQQVERTERVVKSLWRERHHTNPDWLSQYRHLEVQSDQVRRTALGILQNLLA